MKALEALEARINELCSELSAAFGVIASLKNGQTYRVDQPQRMILTEYSEVWAKQFREAKGRKKTRLPEFPTTEEIKDARDAWFKAQQELVRVGAEAWHRAQQEKPKGK